MSPRPTINPKKRKTSSGKKVSIFSINMHKKREEIGLSQTEVAAIVGVHPSQISQYEGGIFPTTPERIVAIADALGVSLDWLFGREK